jgi:hypothetical protein
MNDNQGNRKNILTLMLCPEKELNEMWFFFQISALKILAVH